MSSIVDCKDHPIGRQAVDGRSPADAAPSIAAEWIAAALRVVGTRFFAWRDYRRTVHELGKLDAWILRDIGLTRADLPRGASAGDLRGIAELLTPAAAASREERFAVGEHGQSERIMR